MTESEFADFLNATEQQAHRVLEADGTWSTYDAGIAFQSLSMNAMAASTPDGFIPEVPAGLYQVWGALTDEIDAPGRGSPEQDAAAVEHMKKAATEWLVVLHSQDSRAAYLDRWVYEECGYQRKGTDAG